MSDLKHAIMDAKYIDMISIGDFVVRDCGLPVVDSDGNLMPQATDIAAALFRWAADAQAASGQRAEDTIGEYDENGDPILDVAEAERREAELKAQEAAHG